MLSYFDSKNLIVVSLLTASTGGEITEDSLRFFSRWKNCNCLSLWLSARTQQPLQPGGMQASIDSCVDPALPRPAVQHQTAAEFSLFSKRLLLLGWSSPMCRPRVSVNMCVSECVRVGEFVSCCLHVLWIHFVLVALQVCIFAQNCSSHGFPSRIISHGCNLGGW